MIPRRPHNWINKANCGAMFLTILKLTKCYPSYGGTNTSGNLVSETSSSSSSSPSTRISSKNYFNLSTVLLVYYNLLFLLLVTTASASEASSSSGKHEVRKDYFFMFIDVNTILRNKRTSLKRQYLIIINEKIYNEKSCLFISA